MYRALLILVIFLSQVGLYGQSIKPNYALFNSKGKKISYAKMVKKLVQNDLVVFGEHHDNPIAHWLELEILTELDQKAQLTIGLEMFETDQQIPLNQYLNDSISFSALDSAITLWSNYTTDYAPLIQYAKNHSIPVIATNCPRQYARMIYQKGFEAMDNVNSQEKTNLPPLPIPYDASLPGYVKMMNMMGGHGGENLPKAQAIKDATMAYSIVKNYRQGELFYHINGAYHSDHHEGILYYLNIYNDQLHYQTITTVSQADIGQLNSEHIGKADYIICVIDNMTKTYK